MDKILSLNELAVKLSRLKADGRAIVLCHGVFDLLHIGHIRYLREARRFGDVLAVTLTPDRFVDKGPNRPAFTEQHRAEMLASLDVVDFVAVNEWPTAENTLRALRPNVYAKGADFRHIENDPTGKLALEAEVVREIGAEFRFTKDVVFSSSHLINQHLEIYSKELNEYLALLRPRYRPEEATAWLDRIKNLKVLVVGDAIIDEYVYCSPLGLSSKDATLALRRISDERFNGGALAVARHVAGLGGQVTLYTLFGQDCPRPELLKRELPESLELIYDFMPGAPTVCKRRYLDSRSLTKYLEIYEMSEHTPLPEVDQLMRQRLQGLIKKFDLVISADFGHGAVGPSGVEFLTQESPFLAVNTQANAGNRGYHLISRYPRADFISLAEPELRLAFQDRSSAVYELMVRLFNRLQPQILLITCGAEGLKGLDRNDFIQTPAVAARPVDRVGAGDALFAITALLARLNCPLDLMGLMGNIAGASQVAAMGNDTALEATQIRKTLTAMFK